MVSLQHLIQVVRGFCGGAYVTVTSVQPVFQQQPDRLAVCDLVYFGNPAHLNAVSLDEVATTLGHLRGLEVGFEALVYEQHFGGLYKVFVRLAWFPF